MPAAATTVPPGAALTSTERRLNTVCPYFTMFPLTFPLEALAGASPGSWVLDPFCGRGTTAFAARVLGLPSVGVDANPVAAAIAAAKVAPVDPYAVEALAARLLDSGHEPDSVPQGEFWEWAFDPRTLRTVCSLREQLLGRHDPSAALLRAVVLGILHGPLRKREAVNLSNQMPRTYATKPGPAVRYWRARGMRPPSVDVRSAVLRRIWYVLGGAPAAVRPAGSSVLCGDSAIVLKDLPQQFSHVVTSPPYYGMRTYFADQWLRNWFLGGPEHVEYQTQGQVRHSGLDAFLEDLSAVWAATARRCRPGATLAIRFGALPSVGGDAEEILRRSLEAAGCGWTVAEVRDAGQPSAERRQAAQMGTPGSYAREIDCFAVLGPSPRAAA